MPCATPMLPAYTKTFRPASGEFATEIEQPVSGASASQFCSTSTRRPGRLAQSPKYGALPGVCTPIWSATEYW